MHYDVSCSFKVTLGNGIICQRKGIMHYIVSENVQTQVTFNRVTSYKKCLNYQESNFFQNHMVV